MIELWRNLRVVTSLLIARSHSRSQGARACSPSQKKSTKLNKNSRKSSVFFKNFLGVLGYGCDLCARARLRAEGGRPMGHFSVTTVLFFYFLTELM